MRPEKPQDFTVSIEKFFQEFLSGRRSFAALTEALSAMSAEPSLGLAAVDAVMVDLINRGRLPQDLAQILRSALGMKAPAPRDVATATVDIETASVAPESDAWLDPPTEIVAARSRTVTDPASVVRGSRYRQEPPALRMPESNSLPLPKNAPLHAQVDEAILSSLAGDFKNYRNKNRREPEQRTVVQDKLIDSALESFRGIRLRRDAEKASDGNGRAFDVTAEKRAGSRERGIGVGTILKDRFVLDREIGRGGMGVVYRAVDRRRLEASHHQPYVAVKLLSADVRQSPEMFRAIESEARRAQNLAHPNIVTIFDFDRDGATLFIVMELLTGRPLDAILKDSREAGLGYERSRPLVDEICRGLAHAHEQGVIHCDLKPENVFVLESGAVKLLDFGLAIASRGGVFEPAQVDGYTLAYASPEILSGVARHPADDVYALGCLVYIMLTGRHPFGGCSAREAMAKGMVVSRPIKLPGAAWRALRKALSFERAARPGDAGAFHRAYAAKGFMRWFRR
jgi:tRNA A-37 threonylcarbamoyl transferase component Bud32